MEEKEKGLETLEEVSTMNDEYKDVTFEKEVPFELPDDDIIPEAVPVDEPAPEKREVKKIDLSKLTIIEERDPIAKRRELQTALYGSKAAFQIVAAQSGYVAKVAPLVHKDAINILYTNLSRYEYKKNLFKVIYEKVVEFSVGQMTFDEWLKNTSVEDLETFYYGIYCVTFPDSGVLSIECPECGESKNVKISNLNLAKTTNKKAIQKLIKDVSANSTSKERMAEYSLIGKVEGIQLSDSKIVAKIRTPSLWDSLELLRLIPEEVIDKDVSNLTNMLYIESLLIPSSTKNGYIEIDDRQKILNIIESLSIDDAQDIQVAVSDKVDKNRITYSIKNYKCPNCGHKIDDIPVSIEDILFTLIYEKIQ